MTNKPDLTLIDMNPLDMLPKEAYDHFKKFVLENRLQPSKALYSIMGKYKCNEVHVLSIVHLVEHTYPELDITRQDTTRQGFRNGIVDSTYPKNQNQFSDQAFDNGIKELLSLPPAHW